MATLIYKSDLIDSFQDESSIRINSFKVFLTHLAAGLPSLQRQSSRRQPTCDVLHNNTVLQPNSTCMSKVDADKYKNNILRFYNKHKLVNYGATNYKIIRPLLYLSRTDITLICKTLKIPLYPDKSNQSLKYSRNRIRKQLLPILKLFYNPQIEQALFRFTEIVSKEQSFIAFLLKAIPKNFLSKRQIQAKSYKRYKI